MGKIAFMAPVEAMSGKFAKASDKLNNSAEKNSYFIGAYNTRVNTKYFQFRNVVNPRVEDPTEQQAACKLKFAATVTAVKQKRANPTEWEAIKEGFRAQSKYRTLWGYAFAVVYPTIS